MLRSLFLSFFFLRKFRRRCRVYLVFFHRCGFGFDRRWRQKTAFGFLSGLFELCDLVRRGFRRWELCYSKRIFVTYFFFASFDVRSDCFRRFFDHVLNVVIYRNVFVTDELFWLMLIRFSHCLSHTFDW